MPTMTKTKTTKVNFKSQVKKYTGICSTCNNAPTCMYLKDRRPPVSQCEEFDNYSAARPTVTTGSSTASDPVVTSTDQDKKAVMYKGLCINCENRRDCTLTKHEGGIWHCEEYR